MTKAADRGTRVSIGRDDRCRFMCTLSRIYIYVYMMGGADPTDFFFLVSISRAQIYLGLLSSGILVYKGCSGDRWNYYTRVFELYSDFAARTGGI